MKGIKAGENVSSHPRSWTDLQSLAGMLLIGAVDSVAGQRISHCPSMGYALRTIFFVRLDPAVTFCMVGDLLALSGFSVLPARERAVGRGPPLGPGRPETRSKPAKANRSETKKAPAYGKGVQNGRSWTTAILLYSGAANCCWRPVRSWVGSLRCHGKCDRQGCSIQQPFAIVAR